MTPQNRKKLADRVNKTAEAALQAKGYVSPIDVLLGIGWLEPGAQGKTICLEAVVHSNLPRISEAMKLFRSWAAGKGLSAKETQYAARMARQRPLRFSRSGNHTIEKLYRTLWVSRDYSDRRRERSAEKASPPAEPVVPSGAE